MKKYFFVVLMTFSFVASANDVTKITSKTYVDTEVAKKQDAVPAVNANTVLTHTNTAGVVGQKAIYDATGSYAGQENALVTAGTADAAIQMAVDGELVCTLPNPNDPDGCWGWMIVAQSPNRFPVPANQTQTSNGVTVTVRDGVYSFSGTTTDDTAFDFELPVAYTFPVSVEHGGQGVLYLWNNKIVSNDGREVYVRWLRSNKSEIDLWSISGARGINRVSKEYYTQIGGVVKYVRVTIASGINVDGFSFAPMMVEDGVTTYSRFEPYNPSTYMPQN